MRKYKREWNEKSKLTDLMEEDFIFMKKFQFFNTAM